MNGNEFLFKWKFLSSPQKNNRKRRNQLSVLLLFYLFLFFSFMFLFSLYFLVLFSFFVFIVFFFFFCFFTHLLLFCFFIIVVFPFLCWVREENECFSFVIFYSCFVYNSIQYNHDHKTRKPLESQRHRMYCNPDSSGVSWARLPDGT